MPRWVIDAPSLETIKARLVGALINLIWLKTFLLVAGGVGLDDLESPFKPKPFYGSMNTHA